MITAFTGDSSHSIQVGVLSVPADEESWSPRLRVYFKTLAQYYARRRETPLGNLMVTNLSTFPSSLTIVLVPDGNLRKHREDFFVSEDLKRLGCSGRVGLTIAPPTLPTQAKFHQLYRVSDRIDFYSAVVELVKLCQVALVLFGCLDAEYADGLLCDFTERAVMEWWLRIGTDMYGVEPNDGVLGHTTVAALLGTLIGARNRLNAYGAPIAKDVFDIDTTTKAISSFQRSQRIHRSRRLDRSTLDRLQKATAKQASGDGWAVPKVVKSTVAELSGKGGEMVMEIVGKADKASIGDVETVDIERFAQLVRGERARWLWHGKSRKRTTRDIFSTDKPVKRLIGLRGGHEADHAEDVEQADDRDLAPESQRHPTELPHREDEGRRASIVEEQGYEKDTAFSRAKGRIKGAVGLRGHQSGKSKDMGSGHGRGNKSIESLDAYGVHSPATPRESEDTLDQIPEQPQDEPDNDKSSPSFTKTITETPVDTDKFPTYEEPQPELGPPFDYDTDPEQMSRRGTTDTTNTTNSMSRVLGTDLPEDRAPHIGRLLRRTQSSGPAVLPSSPEKRPDLFPRQLSYSVAEESVHGSFLDAQTPAPQQTTSSPKSLLFAELLRAEDARRLRSALADLDTGTARWVSRTVADVEELDNLCAADLEQLHSIYYPRRDEFHSLQEGAKEIVAEERSRLQESIRDVETLGAKLEYEINALRDKVDDVEDAVKEFDRRVGYTEGRVGDLVGRRDERSTGSGSGWVEWFGRLFGGRPGDMQTEGDDAKHVVD